MFVSSEHLPSLQALSAEDDRPLAQELLAIAAKQQIAVVRMLSDELERCVLRGASTASILEQLVEELTRLGCRTLDAAAAAADRLTVLAGDSGVCGAISLD